MKVEILELEQIPRFQEAIHGDEMDRYLSDLALHSNKHTQEINRIKHLFPALVEESTLCDTLLLVTDQITIEGDIMRLVRDKASTASPEGNQIQKNSLALGRRLAMMAQAINIAFTYHKDLERKVARLEKDLQAKIEENITQVKNTHRTFERQIREQVKELSQREEQHWVSLDEALDKTKYSLQEQIHQVKTELAKKVESDFVRDSCKNTQQKILKEMNILQGRNSVDPEQFDMFVAQSRKMHKSLQVKDVELQFDINKMNEFMKEKLIQKIYFSEQRTADQKRLKQMYDRFQEIGNICFKNQIDMHKCVRTCEQVQESAQHLGSEVTRVANIIDQLKLGQDFRKIIDNLEPQKIINIDTTIQRMTAQLQQLTNYHSKTSKELSVTSKDLHELQILFKAKQENLDPQVIEPLLLKLLKKNYYLRMLEKHQVVIGNLDHDSTKLVDLQKKVTVLERKAADPSTLLTMKSLQEFTRKEFKEVEKRMESIDRMVRDAWNESKSKKHYVIESTITDESFIRFKQLHPEPNKLQMLQKDVRAFTSTKDRQQSRRRAQSVRKLFRNPPLNG